MPHHLSLLRLVGLLLGLALSGVAAPDSVGPLGRLSFREYTREDGLQSTAVMGLAQDASGLLWVLTENGAISYDGKQFRQYGVKDGLETPMVYVGRSDAKGRFWVCGRTGLARFDGQRFVPYAPFKQRSFVYIAPWKDGKVLLMDRETRVVVGDDEQGFSPLVLPPEGSVGAIHAEASGDLWLLQGSVLRQCRPDGTWRTWGAKEGLQLPPRISGGVVRCLARDGQGTLWFRTPDQVFVLRAGAGHWESMATPLPRSSVPTITAGLGDRLWVYTDAGLYFHAGGRWYPCGAAQGLTPTPTVIMEDREGSLWMLSGSLKKLQGRGAMETFQEKEGLPNSIVWSVFRDRQGTLYVGTERGLVCSRQGQPWKGFPELSRQSVGAMCEGKDGTLYVIALPGGLFALPPGGGRFAKVNIKQGNLGSYVHALLQDRQGRFWVGSEDTGLWMGSIQGQEASFKRIGAVHEGELEWVNAIREDAQGRIWVAGTRGISVLEQGTWHAFGPAHGLPEGGLVTLWVEDQGVFWTAGLHDHAVVRGTYHQGTLKIDTRLSGDKALTDAQVYTVFTDPKGRLWAGTGAGFVMVEGEHIQQFARGEGLAGEDTIANRVLIDPRGDLWMGTSDGLAHFRSGVWGKPLPAPQVHLAEMLLGRQNILHQDGASVSYQDRVLEVRFSGITLLNERAVHLRAKLSGFDQTWRDVDEGHLRYDRLPAGQYRLELQARIGRGPWGSVRSHAFQIRPAWWGTWWFRSLALLGAVGGLMGVVVWRTRTLASRARHLEALVMARTRELAQALQDLSLANENLKTLSLTDPLTGLRNRRYLSTTISDDIAKVIRNYGALRRGNTARLAANVDMLFMLVDLDHFKTVNDTFGHTAGDAVLKQTRDVLVASVRETDTVIRWGGEEFLVVGRNMQGSESSVIAERIRQTLEDHVYELPNGQALQLTCSIGWSLFPFLPAAPAAYNWERVLDVADTCLYAAKNSGRNGWIGIASADGTTPEQLGEHWISRLSDLVQHGILRVETSYPSDWELHW